MPGFFDVMREPPVKPGESYPLFNRVSVETTSFCNRKCGFCPISKGTREDKKYMDPMLFDKVSNELGALGFAGVVQMFFLNEPFLDRRFLAMCETMRQRCDDATLYVSTNGDTLGREVGRARDKLAEAFNAGATVINLNVYDGGEAGIERKRLYEELVESMGSWGVELTENKYRRHNPRRAYLAITDMRPERLSASVTDQFHDREHKDPGPGIPRHCMRTQRHMVIEHDGRVPICCSIDPTEERTLRVGSVRDRTILEVWNDPVFHKYRWFTQQARRELPACRGCTHKMAYPHVVRKVTADDDTIAGWEREARGVSLPILA
jgi:radical SAM protein with 4Fe4S-binding SPASM domain